MCRHERCLRAGMNPAAVLTEDQKLIRFRKLLSKNKKNSENPLKVSKNHGTSSNQCFEMSNKQTSKSRISVKRKKQKQSSLEESVETESEIGNFLFEIRKEENEKQNKTTTSNPFQKKVKEIILAYNRGIAQIQSIELTEVKNLNFLFYYWSTCNMLV